MIHDTPICVACPPAAKFARLPNSYWWRVLLWWVAAALPAVAAWAQPQNDAVLRLNLSLSKRVSKAMEISVMQRTVWNENYTELGGAAYQLGMAYRWNKWLSTSVAYRLTEARNWAGFYEPRQRFYADVVLRRKWGRLQVSLREALQRQYRGWLIADNPFRINTMLRSRVQLRYAINWYVTPYASAELHTRLLQTDRPAVGRVTWRAGVAFRPTVHHGIDVSFFRQQNQGTRNARTNYITSVGYEFSF